MVNNNDNQFKPTFNKQPFIPKTETKIVLNDWQQQPVKKSPLSPAARSKVVNRSGSNYLSEKEGYGPCSAYGCSYPNVPFNISISVDGVSRNWARHTNSNTFPRHWNYSSHMLGDYYWREDLYLNQIDQARTAINYMDSNNLWVANAAGLFCVENGKFCKNTTSILQSAINQHERGAGFNNLTHAIQSDIYSYAKIATIAVASFYAPGISAVAGATIWGGFKAAEHLPNANEYDKQIFRSNSSFGGDLFKSGAVGELAGKLTTYLSPEGQKLYKLYNDATGIAEPMSEAAIHELHGGSNNYDASCPICNPDN